jgi:hypothetical protein
MDLPGVLGCKLLMPVHLSLWMTERDLAIVGYRSRCVTPLPLSLLPTYGRKLTRVTRFFAFHVRFAYIGDPLGVFRAR